MATPKLVKFEPWHIEKVEPQPDQSTEKPMLDSKIAEALAAHPSYSLVDGDKVYGCGGIIEIWDGRASLWALFSRDIGKWLGIARKAALRLVKQSNCRRFEFDVAEGFTAGHRWARTLGFEVEAPLMKAFYPDGRNATLYALVKGG